ncbi:MAG: sn-glycerol-3-phosphate ABC transporter ATP-binding protein UgpC [Oscillospiraceae bacterium]|nr:sn-glycerol-3-phosphate ABC transporter ATP-binding protein UgpC [Oscillospiraceae bacterium]
MAGIRLRNLTKKYSNGVVAVNNLSLDIESKEFIIFVGPSGCGKSTTLRMIAGLEKITSGEMYIGDKLMNDATPKQRDIAMVFQNYALYPHMSVYENIAFGLRIAKASKAEISSKVLAAARTLDIEELLKRKPHEISGGQRQRVAMGRAIVCEPKIYLMDEPLSSLDAKLRVQMRTEISKHHKNLQTTFIYVTHDQTEAMTLGTRIVVMNNGVVQQIDTPANLYAYPKNLFVADFIGSPQMNFIQSPVLGQGDDIYIDFHGSKIKLSEAHARALADGGYASKHVIIGIRPENLRVEDSCVQSASHEAINAKIELIEMLGSELILYLALNGTTLVARASPNTEAKVGDTIGLAVDAAKIHIFDKDTELSITS